MCADANERPYPNAYLFKKTSSSSKDFFIDEDNIKHFFSPKTFHTEDQKEKRVHLAHFLDPDQKYMTRYGRSALSTASQVSSRIKLPDLQSEMIRNKNGLSNQDAKKMIKKILEPIIVRKVREIIDQSVDELLMKVKTTPETLSQSSTLSSQISEKNYSYVSCENSYFNEKLTDIGSDWASVHEVKSEIKVPSPTCELMLEQPSNLDIAEEESDLSMELLHSENDGFSDSFTNSGTIVRSVSSIRIVHVPSTLISEELQPKLDKSIGTRPTHAE